MAVAPLLMRSHMPNIYYSAAAIPPPPPPPLPPLQMPAPVLSLPPARLLLVPFAQPVVVLLTHVISSPSASNILTDERVDCLLCLSLEPRKLLLRFSLEIPVRPFRRNVEHVLQAISCASCRPVSPPTSSWALCCSSSAMIFSAIPSTSFSTVS